MIYIFIVWQSLSFVKELYHFLIIQHTQKSWQNIGCFAKNTMHNVINLCNSHKALPALKGDIMKEKKLGAKVKDLVSSVKTHWATIFESESAAAET